MALTATGLGPGLPNPSQQGQQGQQSQNMTPGIGQYEEFAAAPGGVPFGQSGDWDSWRQHFAEKKHYPAMPGPRRLAEKIGPTIAGAATVGGEPGPTTVAYEDQQDRLRLKRLAEQAGVDPNNPIELAGVWQQAVDEAEAAATIQPDIEPWDILQGWTEDGAPGTEMREKRQQSRDPFTLERTQESVNLTDPDSARSLMNQALTQALGREASDDERRDHLAALNQHERSNPARTTTTENYAFDADAGRMAVQDSSSVTTGGSDPAGFTEGYIDEEMSAEQQAYRAGTEYNAVVESLFGGI